MGLFTAIGLFVLGGMVQLALETTSELTAETFADNDVGISPVGSHTAISDIVDLDPASMVVLAH
jgi:hypothetical protein